MAITTKAVTFKSQVIYTLFTYHRLTNGCYIDQKWPTISVHSPGSPAFALMELWNNGRYGFNVSWRLKMFKIIFPTNSPATIGFNNAKSEYIPIALALILRSVMIILLHLGFGTIECTMKFMEETYRSRHSLCMVSIKHLLIKI